MLICVHLDSYLLGKHLSATYCCMPHLNLKLFICIAKDVKRPKTTAELYNQNEVKLNSHMYAVLTLFEGVEIYKRKFAKCLNMKRQCRSIGNMQAL